MKKYFWTSIVITSVLFMAVTVIHATAIEHKSVHLVISEENIQTMFRLTAVNQKNQAK